MDAQQEDELALRLKAIRKALNLSQRKYAGKLDISCPSVSETESGKYKPNFEYMYKCVKVFNVNITYLMFGEGEMFSRQTPLSNNAVYWGVPSAIKRFFYYFERSSMVQFHALGTFESFFLKEKEGIETQVQEFEEKRKK